MRGDGRSALGHPRIDRLRQLRAIVQRPILGRSRKRHVRFAKTYCEEEGLTGTLEQSQLLNRSLSYLAVEMLAIRTRRRYRARRLAACAVFRQKILIDLFAVIEFRLARP